MDVTDPSTVDPGGNEEHGRERIYHHEWNTGSNMSIKGASGEGSQGNEEHVIGNWKKDNPYYKVPENITELCGKQNL